MQQRIFNLQCFGPTGSVINVALGSTKELLRFAEKVAFSASPSSFEQTTRSDLIRPYIVAPSPSVMRSISANLATRMSYENRNDLSSSKFDKQC